MDVHKKLKERLQARVKREGKKVSKKGKTSILFFLFQLTEGWRTNTNPASMVGKKSYTKQVPSPVEEDKGKITLSVS